MMVKLDIRRDYDEVKRDFVLKVLANFGFVARWISLVNGCIGSAKFYVLVNGSPQGILKWKKTLEKVIPYPPFSLSFY